MFKNLAPISVAVPEMYGKKWRVPIEYSPPTYTVFGKPNHIRMYKDSSLPEFIKIRIAMANAAYENPVADKDLYEVDMFVYRGKTELGDVAWRASESMYIMVMTSHELDGLYY